MSWYVFEDGRQNRPAPDFNLVTPSGDELNLMAFRNRTNLVMVFFHAQDCSVCEATAGQLAQHGAEIHARATRLALIYPANGAKSISDLSPNGVGVLLLEDPSGSARRAYQELVPGAGGAHVLTVVLDRYSAPYAALAEAQPDPAAHGRQILEWLDYIEVQCPE